MQKRQKSGLDTCLNALAVGLKMSITELSVMCAERGWIISMTDNTCICCGAVIPEGRQICWICERGDTMRLIDADTVEKYFYEHLDDLHMAGAMNAINEMPTIDANPVKRGVIAHYKLTHYYFCHDCLFQIEESDIPYYNFCPHCGAKFSKD